MLTQPETICQAILDDATPCRNPAMAGSAYCWVHREQAEIEIDFGSEAGWLAIDDRSAPDRSTPASSLGQPRIEVAGNGDGMLDDQPQSPAEQRSRSVTGAIGEICLWWTTGLRNESTAMRSAAAVCRRNWPVLARQPSGWRRLALRPFSPAWTKSSG